MSLDGKRFEIPARYRTLPEVTLSYARWDLLTRMDKVEPRTDMILCLIHPLGGRPPRPQPAAATLKGEESAL